MRHEITAAYLGLEVPEPAKLTPFFSEVIGLVPGDDPGEGTLTWRNDHKAQRIVVQQGPANDAVYLGFEVADARDFDRASRRLARAGYQVTPAGDDECAVRRVQRMVRTLAPWGIQVELAHGLQDAALPYSSPLVPGGFLTDGLGFGHAVFATTAFEESHTFVTEGLGLEQSDWLETEIAEGIELEVRFYHCNERHHSVALAKAPFELPQRLHHLMVETRRREDVGIAFDRAWASGLPIPNSLGRHDNDGMFSFYVASPAGFLVEVGYGARVITEPWLNNRRYDRMSAWGHQPIRPA